MSDPVTITAIEQAMLSRIHAASTALLWGAALPTIGSYAGQLTEESLAAQAPALPAVFCTYAGEGPAAEKILGQLWWHPARFWVYAATRSLRYDGTARSGDVTGIGGYQLIAHLRTLFAGQRLGLAIRPIQPVDVVFGLQTETLSVIRLALEVVYESRAAATLPDELPQPFLRFHADYDVPPHGNVIAPLPAAEADARDDVYLEGA